MWKVLAKGAIEYPSPKAEELIKAGKAKDLGFKK